MRKSLSKKKGRLIIISAPSGCGKTTVVERLMAGNPHLKRSVSYTTRSPRGGEENGRDYWFLTKKDFLKKRESGYFLEWANVFGRYYGTSHRSCLHLTNEGDDVILAIDVQGMLKIKESKKKLPEIITVFLMPPSLNELRKRLLKRRTDSKAEIEKRLKIAEKEIASAGNYDYVVVNDHLDQAVADVNEILKSE